MNLLESVLPVSENCECCQLTFYNAKTNHKSLQLQVALEWVTILYLRTLTTPVRTSIYLQILCVAVRVATKKLTHLLYY